MCCRLVMMSDYTFQFCISAVIVSCHTYIRYNTVGYVLKKSTLQRCASWPLFRAKLTVCGASRCTLTPCTLASSERDFR